MVKSSDVKDLNIVLQRAVAEFLKRCKDIGLDVKITQTLRDVEYQNYLFAQGRTRAGEIITKVKGGDSFHNYGVAFDICKNVKGHEYDDFEFFKKSGRIWTEMGGKWGGNFESFVDMPHFEFTGALSIKDFKSGKKLVENIRMEWEEMAQTKNEFIIDGVEKTFDCFVVGGVTYAPTRAIAESLNATVKYDGKTKVTTINSKR